MNMHRRSKRILTGVGIVVVVLGAIYGVLLAKSAAKLRDAYAALEKDGRPMKAADVIVPEVPDEQNAVVLYEQAASMLKAMPSERKKNLLEYSGSLSVSYANDSIKPEDRDKLRPLMEQEAVVSALSLVEEGTQRPTCWFKRDYEEGLSLDSPIFGDVRGLSLVLGAKACLEAEAGRTQAAWDTVRTQLVLCDALRADAVLAGQFARWGSTRYACTTIRRLCETTLPNETDAGAIDSVLSQQDDVASLVRAMDAERLLMGERIFNLPEDRLYQKLNEEFWSGMPSILSRLFFRFVAFRPRLLADHAVYLQLMRRGTLLLQRPYSPQENEALRRMWRPGVRYVLTDRLIPMTDLFQTFQCRTVAEVNITRAGLALLRYKRAHGAFPETLDALGLRGLTDPFVQQPLHYQIESDGFLLYSVSEDQTDNGGSPRQPRQNTGYDQIWRFPSPTNQAGEEGQ
jgi:hypothetical protein